MTATKGKLVELASAAATAYLRTHGDQYPCGFAWVTIRPKFKGNTKDGRSERAILANLGFKLDYTGKAFQFYNPSGNYTQSMYAKECGSQCAADYLRAEGFNAFSETRMD